MAVETFDAFCPTCNMQVVTRVIAQGHGGFSSAAMNAIDEADAEYHERKKVPGTIDFLDGNQTLRRHDGERRLSVL